jgi:hypothetical protein
MSDKLYSLSLLSEKEALTSERERHSASGGKPAFCIDRRHREQVIGDMVNTF